MPFGVSRGIVLAPFSALVCICVDVVFCTPSERAFGLLFDAKNVMKVGRFCKKSPPERLRDAISQLLGPFCDALGSTLRTFGSPCGNFFPHCVFITILCNFRWKAGTPGRSQRQGRSICGHQGIIHFGPWTVVLQCVFEHSARRVPAQPYRGSHFQ